MDWQQVVDPGLARGLDSGPTIGSLRLEDLPGLYRERREVIEPALSEWVRREDHLVEAATGVSVRVHRPIGDVVPPRGCLVTIHGGGFIVGSNRIDDALLDRWCPELNVVGVSVQYRLTPEHPYPAALDDCIASLDWLVDHASDFGVEGLPVGMYGVSAGGALTAAVVLRSVELGRDAPAFVLLDSPCLDDRQPWPSNHWEVPVADHDTVALGWRAYLGARYGTGNVPATAAPARADDLSVFPPACITVGAVDGLVDEASDFARRLADANVRTEVHVYPGALHLFAQHHPTSAIAQQCRADQLAWLRGQLLGPARP